MEGLFVREVSRTHGCKCSLPFRCHLPSSLLQRHGRSSTVHRTRRRPSQGRRRSRSFLYRRRCSPSQCRDRSSTPHRTQRLLGLPYIESLWEVLLRGAGGALGAALAVGSVSWPPTSQQASVLG